VTWRYGAWAVEHRIPVGSAARAPLGTTVRAGDIIASGGRVAQVDLVSGARRVGVTPADLDRVTRIRPVSDVRRGTVLARTGRRFARAAASPIDGRLVHITADGDYLIAPVVGEWSVRSAIDGAVVRSDAAAVTVEGECWSLQGLAAYGPDAIGTLAVGVNSGDEALAPTRVDVRARDTILVGGARMAAEAITRAHACGVAGLVAGAAPAGGLRVVYGDDVVAAGGRTSEDRPTVLCLVGFGSGALPVEVWDPLVALAGERASIHTASARLFVLAARDRLPDPKPAPPLVLSDDHSSVRPFTAADEGAANIRPFDAPR
jgi:hypothetical protein